MEKRIEIIMNADKSIQINNNGIQKFTITESDRNISAQNVYDILEYQLGDKYIIAVKNEQSVDEQVLTFFNEMFENICNRINELTIEPMRIKETEK